MGTVKRVLKAYKFYWNASIMSNVLTRTGVCVIE